MDQLNTHSWTSFKVNLEQIGTFSTYNHVRATCLLVSLVSKATDPLISREEFTCFHILLRVLLKVFNGSTLCINMTKREGYQADFSRGLFLRIDTTRNQKEMCFILDEILESRESSLVVIAVGIVTNID